MGLDNEPYSQLNGWCIEALSEFGSTDYRIGENELMIFINRNTKPRANKRNNSRAAELCRYFNEFEWNVLEA